MRLVIVLLEKLNNFKILKPNVSTCCCTDTMYGYYVRKELERLGDLPFVYRGR